MGFKVDLKLISSNDQSKVKSNSSLIFFSTCSAFASDDLTLGTPHTANRATKENRNPFTNHVWLSLPFSDATNDENAPNITA
ncbi:MAG: hypothetical protein ACI959_001621 [Limisphaerales bacterium]